MSTGFLVPTTFQEAWQIAEALASSDLVPRDYKGKPANILVAMQMGAELGLAPMQSVQGIAVIGGRPAAFSDTQLALVRASGLLENINEFAEGGVATCEVTRKGETPTVRTFSIEDAKVAGIWGRPGPWSQYPKRMLQMRARAFALRDTFPDVLKGLHVAEEVQDYTENAPSQAPAARVQTKAEAVLAKLRKPEPVLELVEPVESEELAQVLERITKAGSVSDLSMVADQAASLAAHEKDAARMAYAQRLESLKAPQESEK